MAATYQLDKILHCVQDDKGLIYHILILPNTHRDNSNKGVKEKSFAPFLKVVKAFYLNSCLLLITQHYRVSTLTTNYNNLGIWRQRNFLLSFNALVDQLLV